MTARVFSPDDWARWIDEKARSIFGCSGAEFVRDHRAGRFAGRPVADDLASAIPFLGERGFAAMGPGAGI